MSVIRIVAYIVVIHTHKKWCYDIEPPDIEPSLHLAPNKEDIELPDIESPLTSFTVPCQQLWVGVWGPLLGTQVWFSNGWDYS